MDGYKDVSIVKLVVRVFDLYNSGGEVVVKSDVISSMWIYYMFVKYYYFVVVV